MATTKQKRTALFPRATPWVQFKLLRIVVFVFGRLSSRSRMRLSNVLGKIAIRWIPVRRAVARENIELAFPELNRAERDVVLAEAYSMIVANFLDLIALARSSKEQVVARVEVPDLDRARMDALRQSGKGFVIVAAHIGNWEWGGAYLASIGINLADVAKPLSNAAADRFVTEQRERFGIKLISTQESTSKMLEHVRSGGALSLLSDQNARKGGIPVPFFGKDASTVKGAGFISYRLGVPVLPVWCYRTAEGKIRGIIDDAIWPDRSQPLDAEVKRITQLHVASLERAVRAHPGQYFWFHRRWKTRHEPVAEAAV